MTTQRQYPPRASHQRRRRSGRGAAQANVNGFLAINKPVGATSMDIVRRVKRLTGLRKGVGHGGTLDPLASGVLPICFGQATRLMEHLVNQRKGYRMVTRLGVSTDTYDAEGQVTNETDASAITQERVEEALRQFRGLILQKPPMHSALKKDGKRLYELARQGVPVELEPREVEVYTLELLEFDPPCVTLESECGRGVYMRSLAHDLGEALGCGGHTESLVRWKTGPFVIDDAVTIEEFEESVANDSWAELLRPPDALLLHMKSVAVSEGVERLFRDGHAVSLGAKALYAAHLESYRIYSHDGRFLGVARFDRSADRWTPSKLFRLTTPSPHAPTAGA